MPKFAKGSKEAKEYMASIRGKRGSSKGKGAHMEGGKAFDFFDDLIIPMGNKAGAPYKAATGVNPFEMGFALGRDVIAPELMKVLPPKGRGMVGGVKGIRPGVHMATMGGEGMGEMEYCPCHHCGGMGIKKKTRM